MKAVLILDEMPKHCCRCPCDFEHYCEHKRKCLDDDLEDDIPDWCEIRPLPDKIVLDKDNPYEMAAYGAFVNGYNQCLNEITGEEEE